MGLEDLTILIGIDWKREYTNKFFEWDDDGTLMAIPSTIVKSFDSCRSVSNLAEKEWLWEAKLIDPLTEKEYTLRTMPENEYFLVMCSMTWCEGEIEVYSEIEAFRKFVCEHIDKEPRIILTAVYEDG